MWKFFIGSALCAMMGVPYAGDPGLALAVPMLGANGPFDGHYVFAYTDADGYHHYRTRERKIEAPSPN